MKRYIVVRLCFEGIHCWPECDIQDVQFLKNPHRHIFYVTVKWEVKHSDRDKEFISLKRKVERYIRQYYSGRDLGRMSCEQIAERLLQKFEACYVSVFEDNENGVEVFA